MYLCTVKAQAELMQKHLNKLLSFLNRNVDLPFSIKRKVLDACFVSSILYSGETWLTSDLKALESMYTTAIKALLGVRKSTCTDLCLIESGYPTLKALVMKRRIDFLKKTIPHLDREDPLSRALDLCEKANTNGYKYLMKVINTGVDPIEEDLKCIRSSILTKAPTSTKRETYLRMNASLEIHPVYNTYAKEHRRIEFTRMRIGAHRLRIETGRWSRTPGENRVCRSGSSGRKSCVV